MQAGFWKADWVLGVVIVALFALCGAASDLLPGLERKAYDLAVRSVSRPASDQIAKNPDDRYQTGEHFAGALRAAMTAPQPATAST